MNKSFSTLLFLIVMIGYISISEGQQNQENRLEDQPTSLFDALEQESLLEAAQNNDLMMLVGLLFIKDEPNLNIQDESTGNTILHYMVYNYDPNASPIRGVHVDIDRLLLLSSIVDIFTIMGGDPNIPNKDGKTALFYAFQAHGESSELVRILEEAGADETIMEQNR